VLVFLLVLTLFVGENYVRSLPNPYKTKDSFMRNHGSEVETLILGSSHAYFGITPEFMDDHTFNLANSSQNYEYDYYLFSQYSPQCKNLRRLILAISYFSFFSKPYEETDAWDRVINYNIYMGLKRDMLEPKYHFELFNPVVFVGKIKAALHHNVRNCDSRGWGTDYTAQSRMTDRFENIGIEAAKRHTMNTWEYRERNLGYVVRMIEYCKEHDCQVIFVTTPCHQTYADHLNKSQYNEMIRLTHNLSTKYDIPYLNYFDDSRFDENDFWDADHLDNVGAEKFSKILWHDCDSLKLL
jgi:hypothetical protein